jgi:hypothetical protein
MMGFKELPTKERARRGARLYPDDELLDHFKRLLI